MGISASSFNLSTSNLFRAIPTPLANRAEISRGAFIVPSPDPLTPSNTAFGTNANAALGGTYISSAAVLEARNAITTNNIVNSSNAIERGSGLSDALKAIANQTPSPRFSTGDGIFTTKIGPATQDAASVNIKPFSPISTTSNIRTASPIVDDRVALTGRNAGINGDNAVNLAAVNASFNVQLSSTGAQALQALNSASAQAAMASKGVRMDGMIPISPSLPSEYSSSELSNSGSNRSFNPLTETFNNIMSGGGHAGGTGGHLPRRQKEEEEVQQKKGINFLG